MSNVPGPSQDSAVTSPLAGLPGEEPREPCPTPLSWRDVMASCREEQTPFELDIDGTSVRGQSIGSGPPLLFLPDLLFPNELFSLTIWLLRDAFTCLTFVPGERPTKQLTPQNDARLIHETIKSLGHDRFSIYAAGFGCASALATTAADPHRIDRLVLQTPFVKRRFSLTERFAMATGRTLPVSFRHIPMAMTVLKHNHLRWFPPFDPTRYQFLAETVGSSPVKPIARQATVASGFDLQSLQLQDMPPSLLIHCEGEGDFLTEQIDEVGRQLPNSNIEWIHTTGLIPYLTHPHRMNKLIRNFLQDETT